MTRTRSASLLIAPFALAVLAGCGGEDSDPDAKAGGSCRTDLSVTYPDGTKVALDQAEAVKVAKGAAYTIYVGDYEIPTKDIATATVTPPDGKHQATIYLTPLGSLSSAPVITAPTTVEYSTAPDVLTFSTVLLSKDGLANQASNASGSLTVSTLDNTICLTVEYRDDEKQVTGDVAADVTDSPF